MAIGLYFAPQAMSAEQYDEVTRKLSEAGHGAPEGRLYHCAFESPGGLAVFDVWESQELFDAFGATLMPLLAEAGVDPGKPEVAVVHNIIAG